MIFCIRNELRAQTPKQANEGATFRTGPQNKHVFSWWGRAGRTYFLQQSDTLEPGSWSYLPEIRPGANGILSTGVQATGEQIFLRLAYSDIPTSDPFNDDFDGDAVSNLKELLQHTDPLAAPDLDQNFLPDDWEYYYFGMQGVDPDAPALRGDGLSNFDSYLLRLNPVDFFDGHQPALTVESGDGQTGNPGGLLPEALTVTVTDSTGTPLANAPVSFTAVAGGGLLLRSSSSVPAPSLNLRCDEDGRASVYLQLPDAANAVSYVTVTSGQANFQARVNFTAYSGDGTESYPSPFAPSDISAILNPDGSLDLSWENHTDDPDDIPISLKQRDGNWAVVLTVPAGTTSAHIPAE